MTRDPPTRRRRWTQFGLKGLLLAMVLVGLSVQPVANRVVQRRAVAVVQRQGGFKALVEIDLDYTRVTDAGLVHLEQMPDLRRVHFGPLQITPAGYARLRAKFPDASID